jgi:hypothetical protein
MGTPQPNTDHAALIHHPEAPSMKISSIAIAAALALCAAGAAQAHLIDMTGTFAPEANGATGTGSLFLEWDIDGHTLWIDATFSGLSGNTTQSHIHCCTSSPFTGTSGIALATNGNLPGFPLAVKAGHYQKLIDLGLNSSYSPGFLGGAGGTAAAAETKLMDGLMAGKSYMNIHTSTFGGGEIRSFVTVVPEPASYGMMLLGLAGIGSALRRRRPG